MLASNSSTTIADGSNSQGEIELIAGRWRRAKELEFEREQGKKVLKQFGRETDRQTVQWIADEKGERESWRERIASCQSHPVAV